MLFKYFKAKRKKRFYYKVLHENYDNSLLHGLKLGFSFGIEFLRVVFWFGIVNIILFGTLFLIYYSIWFKPKLDSYRQDVNIIMRDSSPQDFDLKEGSLIYDNKGKVLANLYSSSDLKYLDYNEIPKDVVNAFIAIEDRTFWKNKGYDLKGIARVVYDYIRTRGKEAHGASTITQQLARGTYLSYEVSMDRKIKEILLSIELTDRYSKTDIMEFYCNNVCFANGIYGIEGAAKAYFNKSCKNLSLSQIAYLCAIPNRPKYYNPLKAPYNALKRRDKILQDMLQEGYISKDAYDTAIKEKIEIETPDKIFNNYETTYALDCTIRYLMKERGFSFNYTFSSEPELDDYYDNYNELYEEIRKELYTKGYKIYTSLNHDKYEEVQAILDEKLDFDAELQGALTIINNDTRKVEVVVGGKTTANDIYGLNRAYQSFRQPGSTIKPILVYTPAIECLDYDGGTITQNIDVTKAKEKGVDIQSLKGAKMTLRKAVENSQNGVAWQTLDKLSPKTGLKYLLNMQFSHISSEDYNDASALGGLTHGVNTVEMASAYSTLANHGVFKEPTCLVSILDKDNNELYKDTDTTEIYTSDSADTMVDILRGVLTEGTAKSLDWYKHSNIDAFAKTGTTNGSKDGWLCGATPYYAISVWVGYDTPKTLQDLYGATYPGQIWRDSMLAMIEGKEKVDFTLDVKEEKDPKKAKKGYYDYLKGRKDSEVLSEGYTVGDYRADHVIGEEIAEIIIKMNNLSTDDVKFESKLDSLYMKGLELVKGIYSETYKAEMKENLSDVYNSRKPIVTIPPTTDINIPQEYHFNDSEESMDYDDTEVEEDDYIFEDVTEEEEVW